MIMTNIKITTLYPYLILAAFCLLFFLSEVPHFRYTDGSTYLKETPERTGK